MSELFTTYPARSSVAMIADCYRFPARLTGKGECIGILAFGGGASRGDFVRFFEHHTGVVPDLHLETVSSTSRSNRNSRHDLETALDVQLAGALAPEARIVVYLSTNDEKGWLEAVFRAIHDEKNRPSVLSVSWGATEDWWPVVTIEALNKLFEEGARKGITVCAASGDNGCAMDVEGHCRVTFPASSPFVLACGGTRFSSGNVEVVWNVRNTSASGGGISDRIPRPVWQPELSDVLALPFPSRRNPGFDGRQLPDVSGLASHSYSVHTGGVYRNHTAGTSAVAPLWSALIARLNQRLRERRLPPVGHFHPRLYGERCIQQSFRPIRAGHNDPFGRNGYQAGAGWNCCAGWGSPDGIKLLEALCPGTKRPLDTA
jgi:kumamolisin